MIEDIAGQLYQLMNKLQVPTLPPTFSLTWLAYAASLDAERAELRSALKHSSHERYTVRGCLLFAASVKAVAGFILVNGIFQNLGGN